MPGEILGPLLQKWQKEADRQCFRRRSWRACSLAQMQRSFLRRSQYGDLQEELCFRETLFGPAPQSPVRLVSWLALPAQTSRQAARAHSWKRGGHRSAEIVAFPNPGLACRAFYRGQTQPGFGQA